MIERDEIWVANFMGYAGSEVLRPDFLEHLHVVLEFFHKHDQPVNVYGAELVGIAEHGPQTVVTHALLLGEDEIVATAAEIDHVVVVGFYIPHDGNVTTVINHMDGCKIIDNADELFPSQP